MNEQEPEVRLPSRGKMPVVLAKPGELTAATWTKEEWEEAAREVREEEIARARANGIQRLEP